MWRGIIIFNSLNNLDQTHGTMAVAVCLESITCACGL
jgi:hypothetical protein